MRQLFLILLFLSTFLVIGQPTCSTTGSVGDVFYPNTVSTPTSAINGVQYLCGPNTVVYDTISIGCLFVHVNTGSTLYYNKGCPQQSVNTIWLKNNSILNILAGCPSTGLSVFYEPTATINNPTGVAIYSVACTSISFPTICATGINEIRNYESTFLVYPNPSSSQINIDLLSFNNKIADISIFNKLVELVMERKSWSVSEKEFNIDNLQSGLYFIQVKTKQGQQTQKLIIDR